MTRVTSHPVERQVWTRLLSVVAVVLLIAMVGLHIASYLGLGMAPSDSTLLAVPSIVVVFLATLAARGKWPTRNVRLNDLAVPRWALVGFGLLVVYAVGQFMLIGELGRAKVGATAPRVSALPRADLHAGPRRDPLELRQMSAFFLIWNGIAVLTVMHALRYRRPEPPPRLPGLSALAQLPMADPDPRIPTHFPLGLADQVELPFLSAAESAEPYLEAVVEVMREAGIELTRTGANRIGIAGRVFSRSSLQGAGRGELVVEATREHLVARYRFDLRLSAGVVTAFVGAFIIIALTNVLSVQAIEHHVSYPALFGPPSLFWLLAVGGSWLSLRDNMRQLLRNAAERVRQTPHTDRR